MIDKSKSSLSEVLSQIKDGATILIGGFGTAGQPAELIDGLIELGVETSPSQARECPLLVLPGVP